MRSSAASVPSRPIRRCAWRAFSACRPTSGSDCNRTGTSGTPCEATTQPPSRSSSPCGGRPEQTTREDAHESRLRQPLPCGLSPFRGLALGCGLVQGHGGANESLQRLLVYLLALVEVDGTPCVSVKTGVEE